MRKITFLFLTAILLGSCKKTTTNEELATPTQDITGFVFLYNQYQQSLPNNSGVTVTLSGTSYSAVTDSAGMYVIKNVPAGTYQFVYTKSGYGTYEVNHFYTLGGDVSLIPVSLYQNSTATLTNVKATYSNQGITVTGTVNSGASAQQEVNVIVYYSLSPSVSPSNYMAVTTGGANPSFELYLGTNEYFTSGQTVYMVAYGITSTTPFTDPATNTITYTSLSATPSAVVNITVQ